MREEFKAIVSGWTLIDGVKAISDRLAQVAEWQRENGPLEPDEEKTVELMVQTEIARGVDRGDFGSVFYNNSNQAEETPRLGRCCICEREDASVRNIVMLDKRSPEPGTGCWGCVQCGLPMEGAISVVCDTCLAPGDATGKLEVKFACLGAPAENRRVPVAQLTEIFEHDMAKHPEAK